MSHDNDHDGAAFPRWCAQRSSLVCRARRRSGGDDPQLDLFAIEEGTTDAAAGGPDPHPETSFAERVQGVDWTIAAETARILGEWVGFDPGLTPHQRQG